MVIVRELERNDESFYKIMGPFFGSRKVAKEVGINIYDDSEKRFFCAFEDGGIAGFLSLKKQTVSDCYVLKEHRRKGVLKMLLIFADIVADGSMRANCNKNSVSVFEKHGFAEKRKTKNFTYMEFNRA